MSNVFDIFTGDAIEPLSNPYARLGYPRNPFRETASDPSGSNAPFYTEHIENQVHELRSWMVDVHQKRSLKPLSLVGNIGAGKTRILYYMQDSLLRSPEEQKIFCQITLLSDTGYSRASVGGMLIAALEQMETHSLQVPDDVLPLIWAVVTSQSFPSNVSGVFAHALARAHHSGTETRKEYAKLISRWLQRSALTTSEAEKVGLYRRIDWEGELIGIFSEFVRVAYMANVLKTFFLFVDQLEDLFRPTFSELRRARILTDLRGLIDEINFEKTPIGLLLSWSPDFSVAADRRQYKEVEQLLRAKYSALYSRMQDRVITLPLLALKNAVPFAQTWVDALNYLNNDEGLDKEKQPDVAQLTIAVWDKLAQERRLYPGGGGGATPRDLLTALADEIDRRAGLRGS